jgi:glycosyltransferase involved in cell wall biosynthesis
VRPVYTRLLVDPRPEVSIVIPTKDRWHLLERTLGSALRQEGVRVEVIVVDDGGSDGTLDRLTALGDPRIVAKRNDSSRGAAAARNVGLSVAVGEWVAFLDDDDLWSSRKLATQLAALRAARAAWCYCAVVTVNERLQVVEAAEPPVPAEEIATTLLTHNPLRPASSVIATRDELERLGGFDETFVHAPEWDLCLRLAQRGRPAVCNEVLVAYLDAPTGTHRRADEQLVDFQQLARKHGRSGLKLDGVTISRWVAGLHRQDGDRRAAARAYLWGAYHFHNAGNIVRALGLVFGERAMAVGSRHGGSRVTLPEPAWLADYR